MPASQKTTSFNLYLIRHGETEWALTGQHTGLTDLPLTENGKRQAEALKKRLHRTHFAQVFTSPLQRASDTCQLCGYTHRDSKIGNFAKPSASDFLPSKQDISAGDMADAEGRKDGDAGTGKKPIFESRCVYKAIVDPDLVEWNYGKYEGMTTPQIRKEDARWNLFLSGALGGEKPEDVEKRADRFLEKVKKFSGNIAVFSSAHLLRVLTARFLQLSAAEGRCFFLAPASLSILSHEHGTPVIILWNDISHLSYS